MANIAQGIVPWRKRPLEFAAAIIGAITVPAALVAAIWFDKPGWFVRASALPLVAAAFLAYKGLFRSYEKVRNAHLRLLAYIEHRRAGPFPGWVSTSATQATLDRWTLALLIAGTVMAAIGDVIVEAITPW